jgi:hypothetical protein
MDSPFLEVRFPRKAESLSKEPLSIKADRSQFGTEVMWTLNRYLSISLSCAIVANTVAQA